MTDTLIQRLRHFCGDMDLADTYGDAMVEAADALEQQAAQIAALRADAERMRGALNFIAERMCSDWSQRCQAMVNTARAALRQEQPKGEGA